MLIRLDSTVTVSPEAAIMMPANTAPEMRPMPATKTIASRPSDVNDENPAGVSVHCW